MFFRIIFSLCFPAVSGYLIFRTLLKGKACFSMPERIVLGYGIGIGMLTLVMLFFALFETRFTVSNITLSLSLIACFAFLFRPESMPRQSQARTCNSLSVCNKILVSIVVVVCVYVFFQALIKPLTEWDSWAIYGFKSKVFYLHNILPVEFLKNTVIAYAHPDYPVLIPLAETWIYLCLGSWNDQLVKIIFPVYFICLLVFFYYSLRCFTGRSIALVFTVLLASIPQMVRFGSNGYADLPFMFYCFVSAALLYRAYCSRLDNRLLLVSAIFAGLAAHTKNEGIALGLFNVLAFFSAIAIRGKLNKHNLILIVKYAFIVFAITAPWLWFKSCLGLGNDVLNYHNLNLTNILNNLYRIPVIFNAIVKDMLLIRYWGIFWLFAPAVIMYKVKRVFTLPWLLLSVPLMLYAGTCIIIYIITPHNIEWHLMTSLDRLLLHTVPQALFLTALILFQRPQRSGAAINYTDNHQSE
jgi:hypothetical protein